MVQEIIILLRSYKDFVDQVQVIPDLLLIMVDRRVTIASIFNQFSRVSHFLFRLVSSRLFTSKSRVIKAAAITFDRLLGLVGPFILAAFIPALYCLGGCTGLLLVRKDFLVLDFERHYGCFVEFLVF